jgi:histidyl-tRNA synthetase
MSDKIQAIRGMNDILPDDLDCWQFLEETAAEVFRLYGYREIRVPVVEKTELFARSIGQSTDIVEKEMYTFQDRNGDSLSLRPEGTAGVVRAALQNGMLHNAVHRLWYTGPMFRHERPQKGRYRQFHQIGLEAFGMAEAELDAEVIALTDALWKKLGISDVVLQLNSLGTRVSRQRYRDALTEFYTGHRERLDEDSLRRLDSNPLRILDSKDRQVSELNRAAPSILDYLDDESAEHFARVRELLDDLGVVYTVNPGLVRGLDYYTRSVFEWTTDELGAQSAICGGGRYDGLVETLGGKPAPAIGFGIGKERLIELMKIQSCCEPASMLDVYIVQSGDAAAKAGMRLAGQLRENGLRTLCNVGSTGFKSQLKRADRSGAAIAVILGEDELANGMVTIKELATGEQSTASMDQLVDVLHQRL